MIKFWVASLAALCAAIAVAYLPPPERPVSRYQNPVVLGDSFMLFPRENEAVWTAYEQYVEAAERLRFARMYARILEEGDSIQRALGEQSPDGPRLRIAFGPNVPVPLQATIRRQLANLPEEQVLLDASHPNVVAVVLDTVGVPAADRRIRFSMPRFTYRLPQAPGQPCISLVTLGKAEVRALANDQLPGGIMRERPVALLGPCAFYSRFGTPGAGIDDWLQEQEHVTELQPNWLTPSPLRDRESRRTIHLSYGRSDYPAFLSCASGDRKACLAAIAEKPGLPQAMLDGARPRNIAIAWERYWWGSSPLGPNTRSFLSDMVLALGEDSFRQFWTSDQPVEAAFLGAAGIPLVDWTMQWARSQIGVPPRGPGAPPQSAALALLVAVVFVSGGAAYAARRQVG